MSIVSAARPSAVKLAAVAGVIVLTSVVILEMRRAPVVIDTSGEAQLVLEIPSKFDRRWFGTPAKLSLISANREEPIASLLYTTWDRPVQQSVPRLDIGVYQHYLRVDSLNSLLQEVFPWHEGRWLPNPAGFVRFQ
jgi:hypothetical protein